MGRTDLIRGVAGSVACLGTRRIVSIVERKGRGVGTKRRSNYILNEVEHIGEIF